MNNQPSIAVIIFGVILCFIGVASLLYYANHITKTLQPKDYVLKIAMNAFLVLVAVFAVDKFIALRTNLLTDNESSLLLVLIQDIVIMVVSYHYGTQQKDKP